MKYLNRQLPGSRQINPRGRIFKGLLIVLLVMAGGWWSLVAQSKSDGTEQEQYTMERSYYLIIHSNAVVYDVQVNGLNSKKNIEMGARNFSLPINHLMQSGENTITLNYLALAGIDPDTNELIKEYHDNFFVRIAIESMNLTTRERERITLMDISYDHENQRLQGNPLNPQGEEHIYATAHLYTDGKIRETSPHVIVNGIGTPLPTERLTVRFTTPDRFPEFHWLDAVELEDTPQMRAELVAAYQRMYSIFYNDDFETQYQEVAPLWRHAAITLGIGQTAMDYVDHLNITENSGRVWAEGETINPLRIPNNLDHHLEFMGEGRLVRIQPAPVTWQYPDSDRYFEMPLVFYKTPSREWRVARILTD